MVSKLVSYNPISYFAKDVLIELYIEARGYDWVWSCWTIGHIFYSMSRPCGVLARVRTFQVTKGAPPTEGFRPRAATLGSTAFTTRAGFAFLQAGCLEDVLGRSRRGSLKKFMRRLSTKLA